MLLRAMEGQAMAKGKWGVGILIVGVVVGLISLFADPLGLGGEPGFGWKQTLGLVVGVALVVVGLLQRRS